VVVKWEEMAKISWDRLRHNLRFGVSYLIQSLTSFPAKEQTKILTFRNRHKGETGFLIANGPSLNEINLDLLKGFPTIGMNRIYLKDFSPTYYVLEDHLVAEDNAKEISGLQGSAMFIPRDIGYCIKDSKNIHYVNFVRRYKPFPQFSRDFHEKAYWGGTVTFLGLQLAYFLGFKKIYIVGLDHSYKTPSRDRTITSQIADPNHFDPRYFGPGKRYHFPDLEIMEMSYRLAKEVFERDGRSVLNATPGTKLDIFEKISFEKAIKPN